VAQITAILDGKRVIAPPRQIQEVRNAIKAYDRLLPIAGPDQTGSGQAGLDQTSTPPWCADSETDLLSAHEVLMTGLLDAPGHYRDGGAGVMAGKQVIHMAPPASRVPTLMRDLLAWLRSTRELPLIVSAVFHYEFEFIHPFADGNGRMGRLWQSLILSRWQTPLRKYRWRAWFTSTSRPITTPSSKARKMLTQQCLLNSFSTC